MEARVMPRNKSDHHLNDDEEQAADLLSQPSHEELVQQLSEAEQKVNQYWERIVRMQADNENAARRTERDVANAHKYALEKFALELLPIIDSLELCLSNEAHLQASGNSLIEGVSLTLKMFYAAMEKFGIKQINPVGEAFNPELQQAISTLYDPAAQPGSVLNVLQKGYTLNNRLLRPALVVVSKAKE
jgi:molecular chaperone GrpE